MIDRIVADNAPFPAAFDQLVARDDRATRFRKHDQQLHDTRLDDVPLVAGDYFASRRANSGRAKRENGLVCEHGAIRNRQPVVPSLPHIVACLI